jgi:hypothetical protein
MSQIEKLNQYRAMKYLPSITQTTMDKNATKKVSQIQEKNK